MQWTRFVRVSNICSWWIVRAGTKSKHDLPTLFVLEMLGKWAETGQSRPHMHEAIDDTIASSSRHEWSSLAMLATTVVIYHSTSFFLATTSSDQDHFFLT